MTKETKAVKITERDIVKDALVEALKGAGANLVGRTKEGLVLEVNDKHVVVKAILKKERIELKDIVALG